MKHSQDPDDLDSDALFWKVAYVSFPLELVAY